MKIGFNVWIAYLIFIFQGLSTPLSGVVIMEIAEKYHVDTSIIGYIFALGTIGGGIAALASGFLIEKFGKRKIVFSGILIAFLAGITITASKYLAIFALGMILAGVGNWLLVAVANFIIVQTYHGEKRSSQLNLLNFFYSFGALIIPTAAGFMLERKIPWEFVFLTPFVLLGIMAVLAYSSSFDSAQVKDSPARVSQEVSNEKWDSNIYIIGLALGLYCLLEISYTAWIVVHLRENLAVDIVEASLVLTIFFICQAAGRAVSGFIVKHVELNTYIIACALLCFSAAALLVFSRNYVVVICLTVPLGLGMASLYPSILSYGTLQVKTASPRMMTFFMTSGIVGAVSGLLLTSFLKQYFGVLACVVTTAVTLVLLMVCIGVTMMRGCTSTGSLT